MNELALFAGAGGGILGGILSGWRTVCAVEIEPYCREILLRRQRDGVLPLFPIWDDVRTFDGHEWRGLVDVISAGFPCQPFSVAGRQRAELDSRNLWPETIKIIRNVRPTYALLENVPGLKAKPYWETIVADLVESGYGVKWDCLRASAMGAPHRRDRLWVVATDAERTRLERQWVGTKCMETQEPMSSSGSKDVAVAAGERPQNTLSNGKPTRFGNATDCCWWQTEPLVGRVVDGMAHRVDRLRALGNGQVPIVAASAWEILTRGVDAE